MSVYFEASLPVAVPDQIIAGNDRGVIAQLPFASQFVAGNLFLETANSTGSGGSITAIVNKYVVAANVLTTATAISATLTCSPTDDAQVQEFVPLKTEDANCIAANAVGVVVTIAGATTAVATGVLALLTFRRPLRPT